MLKSTLLAVLAVQALLGPVRAQESPSNNHLRFAFVGCNRVGFAELSSGDPSSANRQQLLQTCSDLARRPPSYLFLVGDIVTNSAPGGETLRRQLESWKAVYQSSALAQTSTTMVPMVGNHEVLASVQDPKTSVWTDYPNPATLPVWESVLDSYLRWSDGPTVADDTADSLTHDQSRFSFTVREGGVLFVCLNTDTFVDETTLGDVPLHWLRKRLAEAEADSTIDHVFVLGHKPVLRPDVPGSLIRSEEAEPMDQMMGRCRKVRAFLTAHFHLWDYRSTHSGVPQVIAGNGGSPTSGNFNENGQGYFGYTVIDLAENGDIVIENWGRPVPVPYDSDAPQPEAVLRESIAVPAKIFPK